MAPLCAEFGISRKTGYKIFDRYKDCGLAALTDRSRRPFRQASRLPAQFEAIIVRLKREYPGWSAPKIREKLRQQRPSRICRRSVRPCRPRPPCPRQTSPAFWSPDSSRGRPRWARLMAALCLALASGEKAASYQRR